MRAISNLKKKMFRRESSEISFLREFQSHSSLSEEDDEMRV